MTGKKHRIRDPILRRFMRRKVSVVAAVVLMLFVLIAIFGPVIYPVDPLKQSVMQKYGPITWEHPLGTDDLGRDTLARMIHGARTSLSISFAGVLSGALFGVILGVFAGYFGGWVDWPADQPDRRYPAGVSGAAARDNDRRHTGRRIGQHRHRHHDLLYHPGPDPHGARLRHRAEEFRICAGLPDDGRGQFPHHLHAHHSQHHVADHRQRYPQPRHRDFDGFLAFVTLGLGVTPPEAEWGAMLSGMREVVRTYPLGVLVPGITITLVVMGRRAPRGRRTARRAGSEAQEQLRRERNG